MREKDHVTMTWSSSFWLKKALYLAGVIGSGLLIWWLWQGFGDDIDIFNSNDTAEVDTDGDSVLDSRDSDDDGDKYSDMLELAAGTDPLDSASTPTRSTDFDKDGYGDASEVGLGYDPEDIDSYPLLGEDADGDGFSNEDELDAGSDPTDQSSTPDESNDDDDEVSTSTSSAGYSAEIVDEDGQTVAPTREGCVDTYQVSADVTIQIADNCQDLREFDSDFVWAHESSSQSTTLTSTPTVFCAADHSDNCSSGNGVLEINSFATDTSIDYVDARVTTTDGYDNTNAVSGLGPIIESVTLN